MGDICVSHSIIPVSILAVIVYNLITVLSLSDLLRRWGLLKLARRDFYECGFSPQTQNPVKISIQFLIICVFFLLYDIELVFLFPYVSGLTGTGLSELLVLNLVFKLLFLSLIFDYERQALTWQG